MAKRNYGESTIAAKAEVAADINDNKDWRLREARAEGIRIAMSLSENGSDAVDVVADAKVYAEYLLGN